MQKSLLGILGIALVGCASAPTKPIDKQCDKIGLYARSVVTLRDVGVPLEQINSRTVSSKDFPYSGLNTDAYKLKTKNPADAYIAFYQMCTSVGYDLMSQIYKKEALIREQQRKKIRKEELRKKIRKEELNRKRLKQLKHERYERNKKRHKHVDLHSANFKVNEETENKKIIGMGKTP
jgi:hypothetical protein